MTRRWGIAVGMALVLSGAGWCLQGAEASEECVVGSPTADVCTSYTESQWGATRIWSERATAKVAGSDAAYIEMSCSHSTEFGDYRYTRYTVDVAGQGTSYTPTFGYTNPFTGYYTELMPQNPACGLIGP